MIACPDEAVLELVAGGEASDADVGLHVDACPACRSRVSELREEAELLERIRRATSSQSWRVSRGAAAPGADLPRVDGFTVLRLIAEGGMGRVYEAEQLHPKRRVALKLLRSGRGRAAHRLRLFRREADALARLRHPDIATVHCAGQTSAGEPFLAMELVEGRALDDYVREQAPSEADMLRLFARICRAVHHAHTRGVIHRDLKPSNIMVDAEGNPKVLDFGLARVAEDAGTETTSVTLDGRIAGTLAYMSPEQVCGKAGAVDARSDVYSLGVILYELLTGRLPIEVGERGFGEIVDAIRAEAPAPPSAHRAGLDAAIDQIVMRALAKAPEERYQGADAIADDIDRRLAGVPLAPTGAPRRSWRRQATTLATMLLVCCVALAIGGRAPNEAAEIICGGEGEEAAPNPELIHRLAPQITAYGNLDKLEETLRMRLAMARTPAKASPLEHRAAIVRLALILEKQGKFAEAEGLYREVLEDERAAPYRAAVTTVRIARCVGAQGRYEEADALFVDAHRMTRSLAPQLVAPRVELLVSFGRYLLGRGYVDQAEAALQQALSGLDDEAPHAQWSRWYVATALADYYAARNESALAELWRHRAENSGEASPLEETCEE